MKKQMKGLKDSKKLIKKRNEAIFIIHNAINNIIESI